MPRTVLVVDDEYGSLEVLALMLRAERYEVLTASDGEEALAQLERERPDLVITDYKMPKMDGVTLCERMSQDQRWREIPVILMSATFGPDVPRPAQVVAFLAKPLLFADLLAKVQQVLGR